MMSEQAMKPEKKSRPGLWLGLTAVLLLLLGGGWFGATSVRDLEAAHLAAGQAAVDAGDWETAVSELNAAINLRPAFLRQETTAAHALRGIARFHRGTKSAALSDLSTALAADSNLVDLYAYRADIYYRQGDNEAALVDTEAALAQEALLPSYWQARLHAYRAYILLDQGDSEAALASIEAMLPLDTHLSDELLQPLLAIHAQAAFVAGDHVTALAEADIALALDGGLPEAELVELYVAQTAVYHEQGNPGLAFAASEGALASDVELDDETITQLQQTQMEIFLAQGDFAGALAVAEELTAVDDSLAQPYALRAQAAYESHDFDGALDQASAALERDENNVLGQRIRGTVNLWQGNLKEALADLDAVLAAEPDNIEALAHRSYIHYFYWRHQEADEDVARLTAVAPDLPITIWATGHQKMVDGKPRFALVLFDQAIALDDSRPEFYLSRAQSYFVTKQNLLEQADLEQALILNPTFVPALVSHAYLDIEKGITDNLEEMTQQVFDLNPDGIYAHDLFVPYHALVTRDSEQELAAIEAMITNDPNILGNYVIRGRYYLEKKEYEAAEADFEHVLAVTDQYQSAYEGLAQVYSARGEDDLARAQLEKILELRNESLTFRTRLAELEYTMGNREASWAQVHDVLSRDPDFPLALLLRTILLTEMGATRQALANAERVLEQLPQQAAAHFLLGDVHLSKDDPDLEQARDSLEKALELDPDMYDAHRLLAIVGLYREDSFEAEKQADLFAAAPLSEGYEYQAAGYLYLDLGRNEDAVTAFTNAIELDESLDPSYYGRGFAYSNLGETEKAIADLSHVLMVSQDLDQLDFAEVELDYLTSEPELVNGRLRYEDTNLGFALSYAEFWQRELSAPEFGFALFLLDEQQAGNAGVTVRVVPGLPAEFTSDQLLTLVTNDFEETPEIEIDGVVPTELVGTPGYIVDFTLVLTEENGAETVLKSRQYLVVTQETAVLLSVETRPHLWEKYEAEYQLIADSIEIFN
ncbi:MAG: tetratricopeptide repeat protein [Chloroflexota bacterium]